MADRFNVLTVVLEKDTREDDAQCLIDAIKMLRGVLSVKGNVSKHTDYMAEERVRRKLGEKLWEVIYPKNKDEE